MKTKKLLKKLELHKTTIASLNPEQLFRVLAGVEQRTMGFTTCTTCETYSCPPASIELTACLTNCCIGIRTNDSCSVIG